jgi:hypothetical protein
MGPVYAQVDRPVHCAGDQSGGSVQRLHHRDQLTLLHRIRALRRTPAGEMDARDEQGQRGARSLGTAIQRGPGHQGDLLR